MDLLSAIILSIYQTFDKIKEEGNQINKMKNAILKIGYVVQQSAGVANLELVARIKAFN
jgi:hypothetical protein